MNAQSMSTAQKLAQELAEREVDVNEFYKVVAYARAHPSGAQVFTFLDTIASNGRDLVRSGQTLAYYRDIQEACDAELKRYRQDAGEQAAELLQILAWAARLARYYRTDEGMDEMDELKAAPKPLQKNLPQPGRRPGGEARPAGRETKREWVTILRMRKDGKPQVQLATGEEMAASHVPLWPAPEEGQRFRADVTREGGKPTSAVFKGWE